MTETVDFELTIQGKIINKANRNNDLCRVNGSMVDFNIDLLEHSHLLKSNLSFSTINIKQKIHQEIPSVPYLRICIYLKNILMEKNLSEK